jgi:bifunctional DNA-binding transcriptional regulator/antitoxin component of YhaV-PrlF toxin-antitoxin module
MCFSDFKMIVKKSRVMSENIYFQTLHKNAVFICSPKWQTRQDKELSMARPEYEVLKQTSTGTVQIPKGLLQRIGIKENEAILAMPRPDGTIVLHRFDPLRAIVTNDTGDAGENHNPE